MSPPPIIAALRRHKAGAFLIGLQIALTLAIVCNLIFIVAVRMQRIHRPTGMAAERDLFVITQQYIGAPTATDPAALQKLDALQLADLAALRAAPDVAAATPVNALPLSEQNNTEAIALRPDQPHGLARVNEFAGDEQALPTLGLRLIAGRNFTAAEIEPLATTLHHEPAVLLVTQALAARLFPHGDALGKPVYLAGGSQPSIIVGILQRLQSSNPDATGSAAWDSILLPVRFDAAATMYAVRAKPGRLAAAMAQAHKALYAANPMRIIPTVQWPDPEGIAPYATWRDISYALDSYFVQILTAIAIILLLVTGIGMTGLTSFWVRQRHKQIGIRRALGATRANVLHYFQLENLFIAGIGCAVGIVLAIGINLALLKLFQMDRMPVWYVAIGVLVILALGQLAVFVPARRAASVPPVVATRSV